MLLNKGNKEMQEPKGKIKSFTGLDFSKSRKRRPWFSDFLLLRSKSWTVKSFYFPNSCHFL